MGAGATFASLAADILWARLARAIEEAAPPEQNLPPLEHTLPNIVIINADDLGYGDLACYGSTAINTPNIDKLAQEGIRFTDFYACSPVCSPSRYGLLTGRYPARIDLNLALMPTNQPFKVTLAEAFYHTLGKIDLLDLGSAGKARGVPKEDITLAEALKQKGYNTGIIGKWHLGDTPEYHPNAHGFDYFYGVPYSNDMIPFPLYRNEEVIEQEIADQGTLTKRYTEEALAFIEQSKDAPFFLYLAHTFPHIPLHASQDFAGKSRGGLYGDTVEEVDWSVGQLMEKLAASGSDNNTLVVFTSDNGPWYEGSPGGLRGGKGMTFEGGFRVPFIARWPQMIPAGSVCREAAVNIDMVPTCLAIVGTEPPPDRVIDGKNILPLLTGSGKTPHDIIYFYNCEKVEAIRAGNWKYHRRRNVYVWPSSLQKKGPWLFDLESDPGERYDVSGKYPDVAAKLERMIVEWEQQIKR